jgi:drug/metabolite transporter (DMT)-like permease
MASFSTKHFAVLGLVTNAFIWGLSWWPFRELSSLGVHSLWATTLIYIGAALGFVVWRPRTLGLLFRSPVMIWIALMGGINNLCFNWAITEGDVVRVVLLFYLMPVWSLFIGRWLLNEAIDRAAIIRVGLAIAGAALVLYAPSKTGDWQFPWPSGLADWLAIVGGACFAALNVLLRKHADSEFEVRVLAMCLGCALLAGGSAVILGKFGQVAALPPINSQWLVILVALGLALTVGNLTMQYGAARLPAQVTAIVMLSEILFSSVSAALLGATQLTVLTVAGGALIILASILALVKR